jgi:hypothetical protein
LYGGAFSRTALQCGRKGAAVFRLSGILTRRLPVFLKSGLVLTGCLLVFSKSGVVRLPYELGEPLRHEVVFWLHHMKQMLHTTKFVIYETFVIILLRRGVVYLHTVWFLLRQDRPCRAFGGKGGATARHDVYVNFDTSML